MSSLARSLAKALPEPKNIGEQGEPRNHRQIKVLGAGSLDETQVIYTVVCTEHTTHLVILTVCLLLV